MPKLNDYDIGVIVGRFQVAKLHDGHKKLIQEVVTRHKRCIVFVGVSPTLGTKEHPLDFVNRKIMIEKDFPGVVVLPIVDVNNDKAWSETLDASIRTFSTGTVCLYGGRDSFVKSYIGKFDAYEFPTHDYRPGTEIRAEIGKAVLPSDDFRAGIVYSTQNQFQRTHLTVDVLIYDDYGRILLGRKANENKQRFVGGFVESESLEEAVRKEAQEEVGLDVDNLQFLGSKLIEDWRYSQTSDKVLTSFFAAQRICGTGIAGDDLHSTQWVDPFKLSLDYSLWLTPSHSELFKEFGLEFTKKLIKNTKKGKK